MEHLFMGWKKSRLPSIERGANGMVQNS